MKKRDKKMKIRIPGWMVEELRHRGGAHSSRKGGRGYDRRRGKAVENE